ncbi:hypothetical protein Ahy_A01g002002 [Arachis hypogaea]|uniref:Uncharacterized protein n=1 Tax=Arachis hypogaea TaxID=3818 RepID=A0A445EPV9_ARAHY|nr:hypothetical protein Ahy_A01g002002 [Arachis hypogaea]
MALAHTHQHEDGFEISVRIYTCSLCMHVTSWAISVYYAYQRTWKTFNPILGETYEMVNHGGITFLSEYVSFLLVEICRENFFVELLIQFLAINFCCWISTTKDSILTLAYIAKQIFHHLLLIIMFIHHHYLCICFKVFVSRCSFQGQYANLHPSHGSKLQEILEGSNASDNKPFYNFLKVKDPEWGKNAPGSHHGRREAGRYGLDLSLKL